MINAELLDAYYDALDRYHAQGVTNEGGLSAAFGNPLLNTIFEDARRAVLYQNGRVVYGADSTVRAELAALLERFFTHSAAQIAEFHDAVRQFQDQIPELARGLEALDHTRIKGARRINVCKRTGLR